MKENWNLWRSRLGHENLLPIAQQGVPTDDTKVREPLKVPTVYDAARNGKKFKGLYDWTNLVITEGHFKQWANHPAGYGIGLRLGDFHQDGEYLAAVDVDTENDADLDHIEALLERFGVIGNERYRDNSQRFLRLFTVPFPMVKTVWTMGEGRALEILGKGQQCVVSGKHKSGHDINFIYDEVPMLTAEQWEQFAAEMDKVGERTTLGTERGEMEGFTQNDIDNDPIAIWLIENADWEPGSKGIYGYTHWVPEQEGGEALYKIARDGFTPEFVLMHNREQAATRGYDQRQIVETILDEMGAGDELDDLMFFYDDCASTGRQSHANKKPRASAEATEKAKAAFQLVVGASANPDRPKRQRKASTKTTKHDGKTGDYRDNQRERIAEYCRMELWQIPPDVKAKLNKDGLITGFSVRNTEDNFEWMLRVQGWTVTRNNMTWDTEVLDKHGQHLTHSEAATISLLTSELARRDIPLEAYKLHIDAIAELRSYHPVSQLLEGREWDGKARVFDVLDCVNAVRPDYAEEVLLRLCVAAIAALDDGSVAMKFCPVLYSAENDYHKSQFPARLFGILPGAFAEGVSVDPDSKDSVRKAVYCWGGELGELDSMSKVNTAKLKAWIPASSDKWRQEYKGTTTTKPRQTVYIGTVNKDDFIRDSSLATRFPVIELAGPVRVDEMNKRLGWEYDGNRAKLTNPELLTQFWLEVRHMYQNGESYILDRG